MGTLYLVATPIGNLEDITLRALRVLKEVALIAAEDTRRTRKLLSHYEIDTPLLSYHEHNKTARQEQLIAALAAGDVALVSDAGTPGLSDPGYELIRAAQTSGHRISPIPGASAPIAALVAAGLPTDAFIFLGYLPRRSNERRQLLTSLAGEKRTLIAFESPHRMLDSLKDMRASFGEERQVAACRELTKIHEEIVRAPLQELIQHFETHKPRGEFTFVIAGNSGDERWQESRVRQHLKDLLLAGSKPSDAARQIAARSGWTRHQVYQLALEERS